MQFLSYLLCIISLKIVNLILIYVKIFATFYAFIIDYLFCEFEIRAILQKNQRFLAAVQN